MAPPAGTSSMLRSRRRDATLKPNRTLDRSASRGMLYENEELRLRTININAEVEKGQNYIKKLRRENEQLKREIWNLREEYERLENYVKSREQSENEEEYEEDDDDENDNDNDDVEVVISGEPTEVVTDTTAVVALETVVEEDDDDGDQQLNLRPGEFIAGDCENVEPQISNSPGAVENLHDTNIINNDGRHVTVSGVAAVDQERDAITNTTCTMTVTANGPEGHPAAVTADSPTTGGGVGCDSDDPDRHDEGDRARQPQDPVQRSEQPSSHLDAAVLQPHTACFDTGSNHQLHDLTVDEVIDAIQDVELRDKLRTVCLTDERCYMTFANAECLERALHMAFRVRDLPVLLMDTGAGAVILSLTGVPDTVADKDVLKCLKKYGTIIGGVERKTARCGTAGGERYVRVRPTLGAPRYLWFGSDKVIVRQLTEHETGTMNSIARRKSFRSQIKLNLKMADTPTSSGDHCENGGGADSGGGGGADSGGGGDEACCGGGDGVVVGSCTATAMTAISVQNGFKFPTSDPKTAATAGQPVAAEPKTAVLVAGTTNSKSAGSPKRSKPVPANDRDSAGPPTAASGPCESPLRGRRRTSLMGFRRDTIIKHRGGSVSRADGGEDADSDTSTICRRKLSITGREGTEKVPWCGCWGNGCL
ncbi:uncharacterized protein LOC100164648 [Acyrthosiphon pisum]|uniref:Uncharacterized protein n=1 Tax=Acyrthosiphon pisum TaxID=7029 RepID=A0A8R2D3Q5_ACYPI|nr:uncharacterized protein LOC100164648 [Acyrthosiphon pisum]XP_016660017.1 uncharacterized protein LOC100164648 [Acyrthosiphon pisum]XP_016660019.1 uncharacterized protein LOC100164648 [Acyrthosiphon pisum]|eukprot:XP_001945409.2 PREDICTED: uncharacterized protein LOC100164648 [Acyrthosiphon pisum]